MGAIKGNYNGGLCMAHYKKLYEKIRNNPKDVSFQDIDKLLTKIGGFTKEVQKADLVIIHIVILIWMKL